MFSFPLLVGDIGGSNARFAVVAEPGAPLSPHEHRGTHDFDDLQSAIADVLPHLPARPRSAVICAAGPVEGRHVAMTNARWNIDGAVVADALELDQGLVLNDFEAQALALPVTRDEWVHPIGATAPPEHGARFVLGPGTGLGAAALLEVDGRHLALASEAGHVDFGPVGKEETAIWPHISVAPHGRMCAETILSGPGLVRLHLARLREAGLHRAHSDHVRGDRSAPLADPGWLVEHAKANPQGEEAVTVRLFWQLVARFAGDMAIAFLATGGVTFCGGVLPRVVSLLQADAFRARFEDKSPFGALLRDIPTGIVIVDDTVLHGLAAIAAEPGRYHLDYQRRTWR